MNLIEYQSVICLSISLTLPGCEDIVVESLSLDSLVPILKWSSQPYGSKWVHRQAMHFLCEEFSQVVTSDVLYELSKEHLLSAIQSDYLQVRKHCLYSITSHNMKECKDSVMDTLTCSQVLGENKGNTQTH